MGRGARDNRQLTEYLDGLGLQRSVGAGMYHVRMGAAAVAARVMEGLETYADIVRRPHLPESGFEPARDLALQSIAALADEPRQKVLIRLRECYFPWPYGRNAMGVEKDLRGLTLEQCKADHASRYRPEETILSVAGNVEFAALRDAVEKAFGDWRGGAAAEMPAKEAEERACYEHHASEQTHIGIAYPSIPETHADYYTMRLALEVLSGGMSGRLFTEVREKRGLVYNVWAGYTSMKGFGSIMGYAGTTTERAQATLECFVRELYRLSEGITAEELSRAKTGLKAATIMQGESTPARSSAIAHDYFMRGRIRTLDEIKAGIDGVSLEQVNAWLAANPPGPFTIVTVGPQELKTAAVGETAVGQESKA